MWLIDRWVLALLALAAVAFGVYWMEFTSGPVIWGLMGVLGLLLLRVAMLAAGDGEPRPPAKPKAKMVPR